MSRAQGEIDRWLSGQQAATSDAQLQAQDQAKAMQYGTQPGKSSFSSADFGAGMQTLAGQAGIRDANAPIISYPGTETLDTLGTKQALAAQMGLGGTLPGIPADTTGGLTVPNTPMLQYPGRAPDAAGARRPDRSSAGNAAAGLARPARARRHHRRRAAGRGTPAMAAGPAAQP